MSTLRRFLVVGLVLAVVLVALFGWRIFQIKQLTAQFSQPQPPSPVAAAEVSTVSWVPALVSVGSMRAVNGIEIANEVPGVVEEILFESGQQVEQGQVLVRIDAATDQAALTTLRADAELASSEFRRARELLNRQAVSQAEYDAASARQEAAQARVNQQTAQLEKKILRAPFAGVVGLRQVDLGEYLPAGSAVVEINMLDPIFVEYTVGEKELRDVSVGHAVEVAVAAVPGEVFTGTVSAISASVSPETRTARVRATVANPKRLLKPGMFANVRTLQPAARSVLAVPRTAISYNTYGNFVFAIVENDEGELVVERRNVVTGETRNGMVEIVEGLQDGDQVVAAGLLRLRAGQSVVIESDSEQQPNAATPSTDGEEASS